MFNTHSVATVALAVSLLAGAGSATAGIQDGTSNTIMFGARAVILMPDAGGQFYV